MRGLYKNKEISKLKITLILFRIVSAIIVIVCVGIIIRWQQNNIQNNNLMEELVDYAVLEEDDSANIEYVENFVLDANAPGNSEEKKLKVNFNELENINSDVVAWVKVNNTNINFSVVQSKDNNYYLKHNFNKEYNGAGWIFADYKNNFETLDKNTIVYGHNRRNGTMFSNLTYLLKSDWNFEGENSYFYFSTKNKSYKAEIFSVYMIKATNLSFANNFESNESFMQYVDSVKALSIHDFGSEIKDTDKIVSLCTCDNTSQNRIVVHAKLVEDNM